MGGEGVVQEGAGSCSVDCCSVLKDREGSFVKRCISLLCCVRRYPTDDATGINMQTAQGHESLSTMQHAAAGWHFQGNLNRSSRAAELQL